MSSLLCSPCSEFCVRCAILVYMAANDLTMLIYFLYLYVWLVLLTNFLSLFSLLVDHYFIFICLSPFTWIRVSGLRNSLSLSLNSALLADRYFYQCHCVRPQKENPNFRPLKKKQVLRSTWISSRLHTKQAYVGNWVNIMLQEQHRVTQKHKCIQTARQAIKILELGL